MIKCRVDDQTKSWLGGCTIPRVLCMVPGSDLLATGVPAMKFEIASGGWSSGLIELDNRMTFLWQKLSHSWRPRGDPKHGTARTFTHPTHRPSTFPIHI